MEDLTVRIDGKEYKVKVEEIDEGKLKVHFNGEIYEVETKADIQNIQREVEKAGFKEEGETIITAPLPGTIASIKVKEGQKVHSDDVLMNIIAMKMENKILSPKGGIVKEIKVKKNDNVNKGDVLVVIK